jgi:putative ABC transport system permease protein
VNTWIFSMAWRDSRRHRRRLALYTAAIAVGIAALVSLRSLGSSLENEIDAQASSLLGADLSLESNQSFSDELEAAIDSIGGQQARQIKFTSMVLLPRGGHTRLAQIRALEGGFPFYGQLQTDPPQAAETFRQGARALVDDNIMMQFGAAVGDSIKVGSAFFRIEGRLIKIPGETSLSSDVQPRIYLPMDHLDRTHLVQRGSRVEYEVFFKLAEGADAEALKRELRENFDQGRNDIDIDTVEDRKQQLGRSLGNLYRFLNLGSFIALILGAVGVASAVHSYAAQKLDTVAILRSLGASSNQTFAIYLLQAGTMGLCGSLLGALLGALALDLLPVLLRDVLPLEVEPVPSLWPILQGTLVGLGLALLFAARPLLAVRQTPPLRTLRAAYDDSGNEGGRLFRIIANILLVVGALLFALHLTGRPDYALGFTGGTALAFALLAAVARLLTWGARRFFPLSWSYEWRQGLANLFRPHNQTLMLLLGLGLGTFLMSTLYLAQNALVDQIESVGGGDRPNAVLFDIQSDQVAGMQEIFAELKLPIVQQVPIVTMRLASVKGKTVEEMRQEPGRRRNNWALTREYRCTYRDTLNTSETLIAGQWRGSVTGDTTYVSLAQNIAENLGVTMGDSLVFDVQGVPITVVVGSLREVDWQRVMPNFLVLFPTGILEEAPQFHVLVTRFTQSQQLAQLQRQSVSRFPNVSIIDLDLILSTVDTILGKVSFVVRFLALFSIATGLLVLVGIIAGSRYQRVRESVLLRTLGASRRQVRRIMALEYVFLGGFAALTGLVLSLGSSWALVLFVFEVPFAPPILPLLLALPLICLLTVLVGQLSSRGVHDSPPLEVLRSIG